MADRKTHTPACAMSWSKSTDYCKQAHALLKTRKLSYRKDDCAMCPIYDALEIFESP